MGCLLINFWIIFLLGDNMMMTFQPKDVSGKPVYICWLASLAGNRLKRECHGSSVENVHYF